MPSTLVSTHKDYWRIHALCRKKTSFKELVYPQTVQMKEEHKWEKGSWRLHWGKFLAASLYRKILDYWHMSTHLSEMNTFTQSLSSPHITKYFTVFSHCWCEKGFAFMQVTLPFSMPVLHSQHCILFYYFWIFGVLFPFPCPLPHCDLWSVDPSLRDTKLMTVLKYTQAHT